MRRGSDGAQRARSAATTASSGRTSFARSTATSLRHVPPGRPEGLTPPRQLRFTFRQEQRTHAAWAFPSADEQAALHA